MYKLVINKRHNIIENAFQYKISDPKMEKLIKFNIMVEPIIPNTENYVVELDNIPDNILSNPSAFLYINKEYKIRPFLIFDIINKEEVVRKTPNDDIYLVLDKNIEFCVRYIDPDNIDFREFNHIKLKDRYSFLTNIPNKLEMKDDMCKFISKSRFPGICKLRAKDDKYLCNYYPLEIRFNDEIIT